MRNSIYFILIFLGIIIFSCQKEDNGFSTREEISSEKLGNAIAKSIFKADSNTEILKKDFTKAISKKKIDKIIKDISEDVFDSENYSFLISFYFNSDDELMMSVKSSKINDSTRKDAQYREMDFRDDEISKKCYSEECVAKFLSDAIEKHDGCAEFKIDKHTLYANVYARPSDDD
ncbi:MAG TPA: hypothetical protein ENI82_01360 [Bacteroidetes bacterium]|nr:hypothetical protein [Bacteroidota bacterium]